MKRRSDKSFKITKIVRKKHSSECFNMYLSKVECQRLSEFLKNQLSSCDIITELDSLKTDDLLTNAWTSHFDKSDDINEAVSKYFACLSFCNNWLLEKLEYIGWQENKTGFEPFRDCSSISQLVNGAMECYRIACKQLLRYQESLIIFNVN